MLTPSRYCTLCSFLWSLDIGGRGGINKIGDDTELDSSKRNSVKGFPCDIPQLHLVGWTNSCRREATCLYSSHLFKDRAQFLGIWKEFILLVYALSWQSSRGWRHLIFLTLPPHSFLVVFCDLILLFAHSLLHFKPGIFHIVGSLAQEHFKLP